MEFKDHFSETLAKKQPAYLTKMGAAYLDDSIGMLAAMPDNSIDLVMTSPPFALLRKKEYGNEDQSAYVEWLGVFAAAVLPKLKDTGSLVIDIGGAYQKGSPTRSLYPFRIPIHFCDDLGYYLAEDFYWFNSSKLPSPIEWVNKRKIRVKDSVNNIWWFSKTEWPKANVSNVLTEYSDRMKKLLKDPAKYYDSKKRPSGHDIGKSFGNDNGGAIPSNMLQIPNSESGGHYTTSCKEFGIKSHPARFPKGLPEFFIKYLTTPGDLVVDIFGGSNTTGEVAEELGRRWLCCDTDLQYVAASSFRFLPKPKPGANTPLHPYNQILEGQTVDLRTYSPKISLVSNLYIADS